MKTEFSGVRPKVCGYCAEPFIKAFASTPVETAPVRTVEKPRQSSGRKSRFQLERELAELDAMQAEDELSSIDSLDCRVDGDRPQKMTIESLRSSGLSFARDNMPDPMSDGPRSNDPDGPRSLADVKREALKHMINPDAS